MRACFFCLLFFTRSRKNESLSSFIPALSFLFTVLLLIVLAQVLFKSPGSLKQKCFMHTPLAVASTHRHAGIDDEQSRSNKGSGVR